MSISQIHSLIAADLRTAGALDLAETLPQIFRQARAGYIYSSRLNPGISLHPIAHESGLPAIFIGGDRNFTPPGIAYSPQGRFVLFANPERSSSVSYRASDNTASAFLRAAKPVYDFNGGRIDQIAGNLNLSGFSSSSSNEARNTTTLAGSVAAQYAVHGKLSHLQTLGR